MFYADSGPEGAYNELWRRSVGGTGSPRRLLIGNEHQGVGVVLGLGVRRLLLVNDERPDVGGDDFQAQPVMRLYDEEAKTYESLGPGVGVELAPDGTRLAWLAPTEMRTCTIDEPGCKEPAALLKVAMLSDLSHPRQWGPFDGLRGIEWADTKRLLIYKPAEATAVFSLSDGKFQPLAVGGRALGFNAATGRIALTDTTGHLLRVVRLDGSLVWERDYGRDYVEAWWSPDGRTVLVSSGHVNPDTTATERLELIEVASQTARPVPNTGRINGEKVWSTSGRFFGFRRETPDGRRFQFVVCPADLGGPCRVAHTWDAGLTILALDQ